jgi:hypothetical protein
MKRYTGQAYQGHRFSDDDPPLHPVEGHPPPPPWRSHCEICGKEFEHPSSLRGHKICSDQCWETYLKPLLDLPLAQRLEKLRDLKRTTPAKFLHSRLDHLRLIARAAWPPLGAPLAATLTDGSGSPPPENATNKHAAPRHDWDKLQARQAPPARHSRPRKTPGPVTGQLTLNL